MKFLNLFQIFLDLTHDIISYSFKVKNNMLKQTKYYDTKIL